MRRPELKHLIPLTFLVANSVQAATVPKITSVTVTPTTAPAGTMFKFTATLNAPLTTGNKVKIDLGKGLASMTGSGTQFALSRAFYTMGKQTYKVGIYNAKDVLQGKVSSGNYTVASVINNPPTLALVSGENSVEQYEIYNLQIQASDVDNNLRSVTVDWKDGSTAETQILGNNGTIYSALFTFQHAYSTTGKFTLTATAKDSGTPALTSKLFSKTIDVVEPSPAYSKVCNNGSLAGEEGCPVKPVLGAKPTDWACTKDNATGLIWEVKTDDGGLRDKDWYYSWYKPEGDNGGYAGYQNGNGHPEWCKGSDCDTYAFTNAVNKQGLCGAQDWRMPTKGELEGLVYCSDGITKTLDKYESGRICTDSPTKPTINTTYFPNTVSNWFWSSSPYASERGGARYVGFDYGFSGYNGRNGDSGVRLVRG